MNLPSDLDPTEFHQTFRPQSDEWKPAILETCALHGIRSERFVPFSDGSNLIASVDDRYVVKIFPPFHRHQWVSEHRVLAHLKARISVPIPELVAHGEREDRWTYVISSKLPGVTLDSVWSRCSHAEKATLLERIGGMMAEVHSVPVGDLSSLEPDWSAFVELELGRFQERHERLGMPRWFLRDAPAFIRDATPLFRAQFDRVILTGEYTPFNLLVEGGPGRWRFSGMVDFGDSMLGHPEYDFLGPSLFSAEGDADLVRSLFRGYGYSDGEMVPELGRRLMFLQILQRFSHFELQLRIPEWKTRARSIGELQRLIWPF